MIHEELAQQFNNFAYEIFKNHTSINQTITSLQDDILLRRVLFNKYYYALYHKYLDCDAKIGLSKAPNKHKTILYEIKNKKVKLVFSKLQTLRIWADYQINYDANAASINLVRLNKQVWDVINSANMCK